LPLIALPRGESHTPADLESPAVLLQRALALALPRQASSRRRVVDARERTLTKRGVLWLGQTCNLRCHFCYFLDRIEDPSHPEHAFMTLEKAKHVCHTLRHTYGNTAVDIQGGEPTIYQHILELVEYCSTIGLHPTLITNGLVLDRMEKVRKLARAGVRDLLVSVHGLGKLHDTVVGLERAHEKQMKALRNLAEAGVPFRFNCVMTKAGLLHLPQVAELAVRTGACVVNFLAFNPFEDQRNGGARSFDNVPSHGEVRGPLVEALDVLEANGVEANVRYLPPCMVPDRHRKSIYGFQQLPYDHHEWDYASWAWSGMAEQRMRSGPTTAPPRLSRPLRLGPLREPLRRLRAAVPALEPLMLKGYRALRSAVVRLRAFEAREAVYRDNGMLRAREYCDYAYAPACDRCDVKAICDGLHGYLVRMFGVGDVSPITVGRKVDDPTHYIRRQAKLVEPEDEEWALAGGRCSLPGTS